MKRVAIFAHFDKKNKIADYVVYYLNGLKQIAEKVIFVSDADISEKELEKINDIVDVAICKKHGEYDFGSYKFGFLYAKEQEDFCDFDEMIFANDSCYGPLFSFEEMFNEMQPKTVDFWGITENNFGVDIDEETGKSVIRPHLQSYFLVFRNNVYTSNVFIDFMENIKKTSNKVEIINKYEIGLSETLVNEGFSYSSFIGKIQKSNPVVNNWIKLIVAKRCPALKSSIPKLLNKGQFNALLWYKVIKNHTDYPIKLIMASLFDFDILKPLCYNFTIKIEEAYLEFLMKMANRFNFQISFDINYIKYVIKMYRRKYIRIHFNKNRICLRGKWYGTPYVD